MLEELEEIIDAAGHDQERAQAIGDSMEGMALNEEDIDQGENGIEVGDIGQDLFCRSPGYDVMEEEKDIGNDQDGLDVTGEQVIDPQEAEIGRAGLHEPIDEQKNGEMFEPGLLRGSYEDGQAGKKSDAGRDWGDVK